MRGLAVSLAPSLLLSASLDKSAKLLALQSEATAATYLLADPAWSCAWSHVYPSVFFVGTQAGRTLAFDTRRTGTDSQTGLATPLWSLQAPGNTRAPVWAVRDFCYRNSDALQPTHQLGTTPSPIGASFASATASASVSDAFAQPDSLVGNGGKNRAGIVTASGAGAFFWELALLSDHPLQGTAPRASTSIISAPRGVGRSLIGSVSRSGASGGLGPSCVSIAVDSGSATLVCGYRETDATLPASSASTSVEQSSHPTQPARLMLWDLRSIATHRSYLFCELFCHLL